MSHQNYYPTKCVISRNTMASSTSNNSNSVGANDSEKKYMERYVFSRKSKVSNEIIFIHTKKVCSTIKICRFVSPNPIALYYYLGRFIDIL